MGGTGCKRVLADGGCCGILKVLKLKMLVSMRILGGRYFWGTALVVLAGCAGLSGWAKEGTDEAEVRADLGSCRSIARNVTKRDRQIDFDIQAARGNDRGIDPTVELLGEVRDFGVERRSDDLVSRCMRSRGYTLGSEGSSG